MEVDRTKTLAELDQKTSFDPEQADLISSLAQECAALYESPLKEYSANDLGRMLGQNIGVRYLLPLALAELEADLPTADTPEGDVSPLMDWWSLLVAVLFTADGHPY